MTFRPSATRKPALLAALLAATTLTPLAQAHAVAWVNTATLGVPLKALLSALDGGALADATPMTIRVGMAARNTDALPLLVKRSTTPGGPGYGHFLTPAEFAKTYGASTVAIQRVTTYLKAAGFTHIVAEPNGLLVSADGTAAMAKSAFHTTLEQVTVGGKSLFVNTTPAQVPFSLSTSVKSILGLNTVGHMASTIALPLPQYLVSYTPHQFQTLYGVTPAVKRGAGTSIAIMAEGNMAGVIKDLRIAETAFGTAHVPVTVEQVGLASPDVSGADEWDMDTQYSTGMAGTVQMLYLYTTTSLSDSDLALEFSRWATDDRAKAASASLGECEAFPYIDGSMAIDDMIFLEAAAQGQTFFASSGDTGSFCPIGPAGVNGIPLGAPLVNYPAASPYVVGVGGTTLLSNSDGSYNSEVAWYAGGGGISQFEVTPNWQATAVPLLGTTGTRGVPDVAMDADPNSGATVYVNGVAEGVGGTSLSSPLALGVWARATTVNPKLGFAGPSLYGLYVPGGIGGLLPTYPAGGFNDITVGTNGLYSALPGYDLTTGLGTFSVAAFTKALK